MSILSMSGQIRTYMVVGQRDGPVPMNVPDWTPVKCSKICHVQNIQLFTSFRNQCDINVYLDTCSYFVGAPVRFEFQTILSMSYEICNFLRTRDMVELLKLVVRSLAAMLRVGFPQFTFLVFFRLTGRVLRNGPKRSNFKRQMQTINYNQSRISKP